MKSTEILKKFAIEKGFYEYSVTNETEKIPILPEYIKEFMYMAYCLYYIENTRNEIGGLEFETINKERWQKILPLIERLFQFLTDRFIKVTLIEQKPTKEDVRFGIVKGNYVLSLFSGGADSFAGACQFLKSDSKLLLSHTTTAVYMQSVAKTLFDKAFDKKRVSLYVTNYSFIKEVMDYNYPQLRSTLFLMNTAPIVEKFNLNEINIPENGYMMLNPPVSAISKSTKSTRPEVLLYLQMIFSIYFGREIKIISPFYDKTKAEILKDIHNTKGFENTCSCFNYRWGLWKGRCGKCFGCNITLLSLYALGIKPKQKYADTYFIEKKIPEDEEKGAKLFLYSDFLDLIKNYVVDYNSLNPDIKKYLHNAGLAYDGIGIKINIKQLLKRFGLDMFKGIKNYYALNNIRPEKTILGKKYLGIVKKYNLEKEIVSREI